MICIQKFCRVASSVFFGLFLFLPQISQAFPLIPDQDMTPGHICEVSDPDFKEYRYHEQIPYCHRNVSSSRKKQIYAKYQIPKSCQHRYTIDHLIPLSVGGSNTNENLWPEHVLVKATRANLENQIYWSLRRGEITQEEAIETILFEKNNVVQVLQSHDFKSGCDLPTL